MIFVHLNKEWFQNDIHSLVKEFFPSEDVSVCIMNRPDAADSNVPGTSGKTQCGMLKQDKINEKMGDAGLYICVEYLEKQAVMALYHPISEPFCTGDLDMQSAGKQYCPVLDTKGAWGNGKGRGSLDSRKRKFIEGWEKEQEVKFLFDYSDRKKARNILKQNLYQILSAYTGRGLPWGTLTGVRPTKIPMSMLEEGKSRQDISCYMAETYYTSEEKINLSIDIAKRELGLLQKLDYKNGYSLYIGIPFCPSTCLYCSFTSFPLSDWAESVDLYLDALEKELASTAELMSGKRLNCIYIGGGTPTTLTPGQLERLLTCVESNFDFSCVLEYTVEAGRPDSITREKLQTIRAHGITRISINPQTMKQQTLELIGRRHTVEQTKDSFRLARQVGFDNINMDLIMGLPNETLLDVQDTMEELRRLGPDNITVHSLAVKRASRLNLNKEAYAGLRFVNTKEHLDAAAKVCTQMGMRPYYLYRQKNMAGNFENVGYAKEGMEGLYNILIMEEKQTIIACGAGSISKRVYPGGHIERCENVKDVALYIQKIDEMIERKRKLLTDF